MDWTLAEWIGRLALAGLLGGVIGFDRSYRAKEAGLRTHFLVALGSALIMLVSQHGFGDFSLKDAEGAVKLDPSRVAAQIVSGIGFLGAGMIILQKKVVSGLTTAAGLWTAAGIGMAVGGGMYVVGVAATILTLIGLEALNWYARYWIDVENIRIRCTVRDEEAFHRIMKALREAGVRVLHFARRTDENGVRLQILLRCNMRAGKSEKLLRIFQETDGFHMQKQD